MNIAMFTNTYLPHVGGVARSVSSFAEAYRQLGHKCLVIAPEFEGHEDQPGVVRVPAITNFNDSGFSFRLPFMGDVSESLDRFQPDIIHAHHPFLLGDSALRAAYARDLPLVFTHHTLYEQYTGYLPIDGDFVQRAAAEIATGFANACSLVFAPSGSIAELIAQRGVTSPIEVQPTGIDLAQFQSGDGARFRKQRQLPEDAVVIGHVGRIAAEKNLEFLTRACCSALDTNKNARLVIVGSGEQEDRIKEIAAERGSGDRILLTGSLQGQELADAYASFDIFGFASQSETQGLVLAEAMASGTAVVALEGPGVRDVLRHGENGLMLPAESSESEYAAALSELIADRPRLQRFRSAAQKTASELDHTRTAANALAHYTNAIERHEERMEGTGLHDFDRLIGGLEGEFQLLKVKASALTSAIGFDLSHTSHE